MPLPAYYLEVVHCCCVASSVLVFKYWWRCFPMFLISLSKCSSWLLYIFINTFSLATLAPVYDITLFFLLCPCLLETSGDYSKFSLLWSVLNSICATDGFVAFTKALWIWHNYVTLLLSLATVGFWFLLLVPLVSSCFRNTLLMTHFGYLYFIRTSSRCCSSFFSSWGVEQTALTLCVRELIRLYLHARSLQHISSEDPSILFTVEETTCDSPMPCLDTLVKPQEDGTLTTWVYRKPTHIDLCLKWVRHYNLHANTVWSTPSQK